MTAKFTASLDGTPQAIPNEELLDDFNQKTFLWLMGREAGNGQLSGEAKQDMFYGSVNMSCAKNLDIPEGALDKIIDDNLAIIKTMKENDPSLFQYTLNVAKSYSSCYLGN